MDKWTDKEVEFIKANKGKLKASRMAKILHRTEASVHDKINALGLGDERGPRKLWTEKDDWVLENNTDMSLKELSDKLGRTEAAVQFRKDKLDVKLKDDIEKWSEKDEKFLIDNNSTMNHQEIAKKLGRTESAVLHKIGKLGIYEERAHVSDETRWTEEDERKLIENKDMEIKELMVLFPNRSRGAIYGKKHGLKAIKYRLYSENDNQIVADNLDKSDGEIGKLIDRSAFSIKNIRRKNGLLRKEPNKLWTEDEVKFLKENFKNKTKKELAEHFGVSVSRIHEKLTREGLIEKGDHGIPWTDDEKVKLKEMHENGASMGEISNAFPDRSYDSIIDLMRNRPLFQNAI